MAKIVAATLLLAILVDCFHDRTAYCDEFHSAGFTTNEIRKCRCTVTSSGTVRCPIPLIPQNYKGQEAKLCRGHPRGFLKQKKCRQQQTYNRNDELRLKYCLCCKIKNNRILRNPAVKAFCNFSCFDSMPL